MWSISRRSIPYIAWTELCDEATTSGEIEKMRNDRAIRYVLFSVADAGFRKPLHALRCLWLDIDERGHFPYWNAAMREDATVKHNFPFLFFCFKLLFLPAPIVVQTVIKVPSVKKKNALISSLHRSRLRHEARGSRVLHFPPAGCERSP